MERIEALIDKLYQQKQLKSNPAQLLFTVQLLQNELLKFQQKNGTLGTAKVAVTLPVNMNFAEEIIRTFSGTSRLNADWDFLLHLCNMGRARADQWLEANFDRVGMESTVDLDTKYF